MLLGYSLSGHWRTALLLSFCLEFAWFNSCPPLLLLYRNPQPAESDSTSGHWSLPLPTWLQSWVSQQVGLIPVRNVDQYPSGFPSRPVVVLSEDLDLYCRLTKIQAMNRSYTLYTMLTHLVMEVLKIILDRFVLHKFSKVGSTEQIFFFM